MELARTDLLFLTDRPLRFGTPLQVTLYSDFISAVTQNRALVHWCRPHSQGWQIGAFLTQGLPDRLTERVWNDLRESLRYECNWKAWILWNQGGQLESVKILNYSLSGLRMLTTLSVEIGQQFSLFGSAGSRERAVLNGQVQWCRKAENGFQIGGLINGQRGRDLPRMFGNLEAVHFAESAFDKNDLLDSMETQRSSLETDERFLPPRKAESRRQFHHEDIASLLES
jgi:hypothetical protein